MSGIHCNHHDSNKSKCAEKFQESFGADPQITAAGKKIIGCYFLTLCLHQFLISLSSPTLNPLPSVYLFTCYIPFVEANLSPADVLMSNGPAANRKPDSLQGEQTERLSRKTGLPSIATPMETAAQSPALHSHTRSPDRGALQLDPTRYSGRDGPARLRDPQL